MSSEENDNKLTISNTGGMIRRMDQQLEFMNFFEERIEKHQTEITIDAACVGIQAGLERDWEIAQGVNMTFCWCPPGEFLMGSPDDEGGRSDHKETQVHVILTKGFWMAKTQVTQKQWVAIMGDNPSHTTGDNLPVEQVSWYDAKEFLTKLNARIGNADGGRMALPTEAQWEYACRAGELGPYSGGMVDEVAWHYHNSEFKAHPVGMKKPNAWGLHDMHGNVTEWCEDWYDDKLLGGIDPSGPVSDKIRVYRGGRWRTVSDTVRVNRGGNCYNCVTDCRSAARGFDYPESQDYGIGLRIARSFNPQWKREPKRSGDIRIRCYPANESRQRSAESKA